MIKNYPVYDADSHLLLSPKMWEDLPGEYAARRPRPLTVSDTDGMGRWDSGWLIEGRMQPHPYGSATQGANKPSSTMAEFGAPDDKIGKRDLSDPDARIKGLDQAGIDTQMLFPTTLYANATTDPGFEAALMRAYNRYVGTQCLAAPKRLKWAGLLPLRDARQGCEAVAEMHKLGASAAVVYGTAGDFMLSHSTFTPVWDELAATGLPICVHMGMSFPPFERLCQSRLDAHSIGMGMPAVLGFVAMVGHGMMDRYPNLKVAFLEYGAEWLFYMVGRMGHYLPSYRADTTITMLPKKEIIEYLQSGRFFVAPEAEDPMLPLEMDLVGENHVLFGSDFPHGEGRENAAVELMERTDITDSQRGKMLYDNAVRLFGEP
ncbi:MAG: putative TIM-barrel fold metal-dependent hydrolase [Alphaproteobacteria bacterium]|jgi:predicted TIM-barrel fold metal-dependent hydrolase